MRTLIFVTIVGIGLVLPARGDAADLAQKCTAAKIKAAGKRAACLAGVGAKEAVGKTGDTAKCEEGFRIARLKADAAAAKKNASCRFADNGDGTVSDLDVLLMWEQKTAANVDATVNWAGATGDFVSLANGQSPDGETLVSSLAGYHDWRLPNVVELATIVDFNAAGCGAGATCIAAVFGPTHLGDYWSATTDQSDGVKAWVVGFDDGAIGSVAKTSLASVRAVRGGF